MKLTRRMNEVLKLRANGLTAKQISRELHISVRTVSQYDTDIKILTGAKSLAHLIYIAMKAGLLS